MNWAHVLDKSALLAVCLVLLLVVWYSFQEHAAGEYILSLNGHQICLRDFSTFSKEAVGLAQACPVYRIAYTAGVGEAGHMHTSLEIGFKGLMGLRAETIHILRKHELSDSKQFIKGIIGEIQVVRNARAETRVGLEESFHTILVACENDDEIFALSLHYLQQNLDGFLSIVPFVLLAVEVVGFVNKEHATHRPLEDFSGFGGGVADILTHQVVACHRYQVPFAHIAEPVQDRRHAHGDRRLASAWWTSKGHM